MSSPRGLRLVRCAIDAGSGEVATAVPNAAWPMARRPLLFACALCLAGLPLANALFGDSFWGWRGSGSWLIFAQQNAALAVCARVDGGSNRPWPPALQRFLVRPQCDAGLSEADARTDSWQGLQEALGGCSAAQPLFECIDASKWIGETQRLDLDTDLDFAFFAARHWLGLNSSTPSHEPAEHDAGRLSDEDVLYVVSDQTQRFHLARKRVIAKCSAGGCPNGGHEGGVLIGLATACAIMALLGHSKMDAAAAEGDEAAEWITDAGEPVKLLGREGESVAGLAAGAAADEGASLDRATLHTTGLCEEIVWV